MLLSSSKTNVGNELDISIIQWYIASLHIYHFSSVIDFSGEKNIVSAGHRYSWCQQRRNDKYIMMQYTIRIRKFNSLTW